MTDQNTPPSPFVVDIVYRHPKPLLAEEPLRQAVVETLAAEGKTSASLSVVLTTDAEIHRINREFLQHDFPTDVISFSFDDAPVPGARVDGELVVSLDTARRQAAVQGWSLECEVILYVVHGTLHLCGYDDLTDEARPVMRQREREILTRLNLPLVGCVREPAEEDPWLA